MTSRYLGISHIPYTQRNGIWTIQAIWSRYLDDPHTDSVSTGTGRAADTVTRYPNAATYAIPLNGISVTKDLARVRKLDSSSVADLPPLLRGGGCCTEQDRPVLTHARHLASCTGLGDFSKRGSAS